MLLHQRAAQQLGQLTRHIRHFSNSTITPISSSSFRTTSAVVAPAIQRNCWLRSTSSAIIQQGRSYATDSNNNGPQPSDGGATQKRARSLPKLMDFPEIIWPSIMKSMKNWIMVTFIIRPYFDREFNLPDFVQGAKQALHVVSSAMAGGEFKNLEGLVDRQALNDIKQSISKMSVAQRYELQILKEDIYFSFPYQVGVMFDEEDEESQKRFVEITMVFHVLKGLKGMVERGEQIPLNIGVMPEYRDKISICNYRFIKEFTKGVESDWTVNIVNHFKPSDLIEEESS